MDFKQLFLNALQSNPALTKSISLFDYLPQSVETAEDIRDNLPHVLAYGNISVVYPYYYELSGLDLYCLLYTESGSGTLTIDKHSPLTPGTLAFFNCREFHRLEIKQSSWQYKVFFIKGGPIPFLQKTIAKSGYVAAVPTGSAVPTMIQKLFLELDKNEGNDFSRSKFILDILLEAVMETNRLSDPKTPLPGYLVRIKDNFDARYYEDFSLDSLEKEYHVSRFRICREFTKYFNISPIQYLNRKRIAAAKESLVQTDKRIHEIGQMVGFENTNHFIRLFKKQTGVTPLEFRRQPPAQKYFC